MNVEEIPIVNVVGMTGQSLVVVKSFADLKNIAKTLRRPILKLACFGDTQKFLVLDKNTNRD